MSKFVVLISAAIAGAMPAASADAALYTFDLSGSRTANFTLESTMPSAFSTLQSQFENVTGTFGGVPGTAMTVSFGAVFFISALDISGTPLGFTQFAGPPLFTGPTSSPVFNTGTFALTGIVSGSSTLKIAAVPVGGVPEPANWALMLTGFTLVGAALRRRSAVSSRGSVTTGLLS